ncbi:MAG: PilZ domain-containing protein [Clostridium sp.]|uniref:flagellar brake protein n=1 Tax=Clostridium culturomicium TaxID=1499683 RepID=UPI00058B717E|nr:PilZ domain-containing protein [Clostridium culturomicium]MDU4890714.1 PilZ domain-containing protein [Clostridium sp.]MDU7082324.1 PilZ domain-containing protein [Clostridium sp.]
MFSWFNKKSEKNVEKSLEKYIELLKEDFNLTIRTRFNGRLYTSYVESLNNKEVVFRCPIDEREIIRFAPNSVIKVEFISYGELYSTELLIHEKIIRDNIVFYRGIICNSIEKNQRRKNYRLPIVMDIEYTILPEEREVYTGNTLDISIDGMLMEALEDITKKDIKVSFNLDGKMYRIKSTILKKRINYRSGTYLYNLKFSGMSQRQRNEINRYIYDNSARSRRELNS